MRPEPRGGDDQRPPHQLAAGFGRTYALGELHDEEEGRALKDASAGALCIDVLALGAPDPGFVGALTDREMSVMPVMSFTLTMRRR